MIFELLVGLTGLAFICAHLSSVVAYFCLGEPGVGGAIATGVGLLFLVGMYYVLRKFHIGDAFRLPKDYSRYVKDYRHYVKDEIAGVEDEDEFAGESVRERLGRYLLLAFVVPLGCMMLIAYAWLPLVAVFGIWLPWKVYLDPAQGPFVQDGGFAIITVGGSWVMACLGFLFVSHGYEHGYYKPRKEAYNKARKEARRKEAGKKAVETTEEPQPEGSLDTHPPPPQDDAPPGSSEAGKDTH